MDKPTNKEHGENSQLGKDGALNDGEGFQALPEDDVEEPTAPKLPEKRYIDKLDELATNHRVDELRRLARDATFIAGRMALAGQITVFFASPNTGKTLLLLNLVSEAIANGTAGRYVCHFNLDDSYEGLIQKADLGNRHGFKVFGPAELPSPRDNFEEIVMAFAKEDSARETVLILDTLKKFVDVMDKKDSTAFMNICRVFTQAGGSIIALAHTNKHKGEDNASIPAGTSDINDDCDSAYILDLIDERPVEGGMSCTVECRQGKNRGPTVMSSMYRYTRYDDADYERMFHSVKLLEGTEADALREQTARQYELDLDAALIADITALLASSGDLSRKDIVHALHSCGPHPRRQLDACLKRWSCPSEDGGLWTVSRGERGATIYSIN